MHKLPEPLKALVDQLVRLPNLGQKSALRMAMALLKWPEAETRRLGASIHDLRDNLHLCSECGALTDTNPCAICTDPTRNPETLCIVAEWDSMLTLEKGAFYKGHYLILGGLLSPLDQVQSDSLDLDRLNARLGKGTVNEVILALDTIVEAENTASYLRSLIARQYPHIRVSRLALGIPLGVEVKYIDHETLRQSMQHRQDL